MDAFIHRLSGLSVKLCWCARESNKCERSRIETEGSSTTVNGNSEGWCSSKAGIQGSRKKKITHLKHQMFRYTNRADAQVQ